MCLWLLVFWLVFAIAVFICCLSSTSCISIFHFTDSLWVLVPTLTHASAPKSNGLILSNGPLLNSNPPLTSQKSATTPNIKIQKLKKFDVGAKHTGCGSRESSNPKGSKRQVQFVTPTHVIVQCPFIRSGGKQQRDWGTIRQPNNLWGRSQTSSDPPPTAVTTTTAIRHVTPKPVPTPPPSSGASDTAGGGAPKCYVTGVFGGTLSKEVWRVRVLAQSLADSGTNIPLIVLVPESEPLEKFAFLQNQQNVNLLAIKLWDIQVC